VIDNVNDTCINIVKITDIDHFLIDKKAFKDLDEFLKKQSIK